MAICLLGYRGCENIGGLTIVQPIRTKYCVCKNWIDPKTSKTYAMDTAQLMTSLHTAEATTADTTTAAPARSARKQVSIPDSAIYKLQRLNAEPPKGLSNRPGSGKPSLLWDQQAVISKPLDVEYLVIHIDRLAQDANIEFNAPPNSQQQAPYVPTSYCFKLRLNTLLF
ncbi:hypothetical protein ACOME3_009388 [Neoechinorhynchus agilis]